MIMFLVFVIVLLILLIFFLAYKLYTFSLIIIEMEDGIEKCLDILEDRYKNVNKILQKEVFFDSIEVRQTINEIRLTHEAILEIANLLTKNTKMIGNNEIKEKNVKKE